MGLSASEIKVLVSVFADNQGSIKQLANNLQNVNKSAKDLGNTSFDKADDSLKHYAASMVSLREGIETLGRALKFVTGGFLALESVRFLKDLADTAGRAQVLGTVLHIVGSNAGYAAKELDSVDKSVQKMGITAQASRQALTQLIQAGLSLDSASKLARAAQDLAVVSGQNSSQTFARLITNIEQLDVVGLRWMGIVVSNTAAQQKFISTLKNYNGTLTQQQKQQALLNEVLDKAGGLAGSYEAALGDVSKQVASLDRYITTLKNALGQELLPVYLMLVEQTTLFFKATIASTEAANEGSTVGESFATALGKVLTPIRVVAELAFKAAYNLRALAAAYVAFQGVVLSKKVFVFLLEQIGGLIASLISAVAWMENLTLAEAGMVALTAAVNGLRAAFASVTAAMSLTFSSLTVGLLVTVGTVIASIAAVVAAGYGAYRLYKYFFGDNAAASSSGALDPRDKNLDQKRYKKRLEDLGKEVQQADQILFTDKYNFSEHGLSGSANFGKIAGAFDTEVKAIGPFNLTKGEATDKSRIAITALAKAVENPKDLEQFNRRLQEFKRISGIPSDVQLAKDLAVVAKIGSQKESIQAVSEAINLYKEQLRNRSDATRIALETELDTTKQSNALKEATDKEAFDKGLISISQYYDKRRERITEENELEVKLAKQQLQAAQGQVGLATTPEARAAAENQVSEQRKNVQLKQGELQLNLATANREENEKYLSLQDRITNLKDQAATITGGEAAQVQQIVDKYEQQVRILNDANEKKALAAVRDAQLADLHLQNENKVRSIQDAVLAHYNTLDGKIADINLRYEEQLHALKDVAGAEDALSKQRDIDIRKAKLDDLARRGQIASGLGNANVGYARATIDSLDAQGALTPAQKMKFENDLIDQQIKLLRDQKAIKDEQIAQTKAELDQLKEKLQLQGKTAEDIKESTQGLYDELNQLSKESIELDTQLVTLGSQFDSYAKQIRKSFSDNLTSSLESVIEHTKSVGDAFHDLANSIKHDIISIFAENIASTITKNLFGSLFKGSSSSGGGGGLLGSLLGPLLGGFGSKGSTAGSGGGGPDPALLAGGGMITGPGTGTSDSIPAMLSNKEYVMPAAPTHRYLPILEAMRTGTLTRFAEGGLASLQSIAMPRMRLAAGGLVQNGTMTLVLHPEMLQMTMREWFEQEMVRQYGMR